MRPDSVHRLGDPEMFQAGPIERTQARAARADEGEVDIEEEQLHSLTTH